ncbi:uncharacterized protein N7518_008993 [Penicillium psychrosexuale]|uniref:uncharacterized protein n=1 Tax=Penicillium psychrosexuale TaxID=1002107 RepID=UPI002545B3BA|nr:uncharacterized protein N7518_008993 [Penicillium psychrosexuale]KAJ5783316.1 hypothetical protein N7518_008993 [Penicillium psychrosexuale]
MTSIGDIMTRSTGGSPSLASLRVANDDFYELIQIRYKQLHAVEEEHRPALPLKRNGEVNGTEMRRQLHKMGHTGACVSCEAESAAIGKFPLPLTPFKLVQI